MSKKSRRNTNRRAVKLPESQGVVLQVPTAGKTTLAPVEQSDYSYVITDLRRVAILAASIFALLVTLSLFIR